MYTYTRAAVLCPAEVALLPWRRPPPLMLGGIGPHHDAEILAVEYLENFYKKCPGCLALPEWTRARL